MALKTDLLRRVMPAISAVQDTARAARRDIERYDERLADGENDPRYALAHAETIEEARAYLESGLTHYFHTLALGLEAAGFREACQDLRARWRAFDGNLTATTWDGEHEYTASAPLSFLDTIAESLRPLVGDTSEERELERLERFLSATATTVRDDGAPPPTKEGDVEAVMHKYLRVFYDADFVPKPNIAGAVQNFEPDCGLRHLKVAIEWKFADNKTEAKGIARGILEDTQGYRGSLDWTRFYAVLYQTDAWLTEHRYREAVRRVGADTWKVIVVTGTGRRNEKKAKT